MRRDYAEHLDLLSELDARGGAHALKDSTAWFTPPDYVDPEQKPRRNQLRTA